MEHGDDAITGHATACTLDQISRVALSQQTVSACTAVLRRFQQNTRDLGAAGLVGPDGSELASVHRDHASGVGIGKLPALTSAMAAVGSALARETGQGACRSMIVDADEGRTLILTISVSKGRFSLFVISGDGALLGQLIVNARKCIGALEQILELDSEAGSPS